MPQLCCKPLLRCLRQPMPLPCPACPSQLVGAGLPEPAPACAAVHAPLALLPVPYPRATFERAKAAALAFNSMIDAVASDEAYLQQVLAAAAQEDEFTVGGWREWGLERVGAGCWVCGCRPSVEQAVGAVSKACGNPQR